MALGHSPQIVREGLVLYLDAANPKSYPGSGTTTFDLTKNSNNGSLINGVGFTDTNNGAFIFDGVNDYINTSYKIISGTSSVQPISIDFFIKPDSTQGATSNAPNILGSAYYSGFGLQMTAPNVFRNWLRLSTGTFVQNLNLVINQFNHVVLIWGGESDSRLYSYVNGILVGDSAVTYGAFGQNHDVWPFRVGFPYTTGGNTATGYFKGEVSNVKIYNKKLSSNEVEQNFNALRGRYGI